MLKEEQEFFHNISPKILKLIQDTQGSSHNFHQKGGDPLNYATDTDIAIEKTVTEEINRRFPADKVYGEELASDYKLSKGRAWLMDPLCGTANFARGFKTFSTNIALAQGDKLIAACVIDHNRNNYVWSTGGGKIFINKKETKPEITPGVKIDVDFGAFPLTDNVKAKEQCLKLVSKVSLERDYTIWSLSTTLSFAYVALGIFDAYVNVLSDKLHISAASFLVQESGGIVTDFSGNPWTLESETLIVARDKKLHEELLGFLKS